VNVAARLEGIAQPGGICISGSTFEQVKNKLSIGFKDLGLQQVKNIPEPISAFGITSAPVAVVGEAGGTASGSGRKRSVAIAAIVAATVVVGGLAFWQLSPPGSAPLTEFPTIVSIDEMRAEEIRAFMSGMAINGNRTSDGQPFTIVLNADMTANYQFARTGDLSGTMARVVGKWRAEDSRFCMQIQHFSAGREVCPRIEKNGYEITARSGRDSTLLSWSLTK
jgi:hypothetical protein